MNTSMSPILPVVLLILVGVLLWRLRKRERNYSPAERANKISEALREGRDVRIVYWSKSRKRFVKEIVTPESLDGLYMKAHDHARGITRRFKITRIKEIVVYPASRAGQRADPSGIPEECARDDFRAAACGGGLALLASTMMLSAMTSHSGAQNRRRLGSELRERVMLFQTPLLRKPRRKRLSEKVPGPVTNRSDVSPLESKLKNSRGLLRTGFCSECRRRL